jgi:hypothetical protein
MASTDQQVVENTFEVIDSQSPRVPNIADRMARPIEVIRHVQRLGLFAEKMEGSMAKANMKPTVIMM